MKKSLLRKINLVLIILLGFVVSCVDPLDIIIDEEVNILIVEGSITTQPGSFAIRLTRSAKYGSIFDGFVRPEQRSKVIIRDSDGIDYKLTEKTYNWVDGFGYSHSSHTGTYYTADDFHGVVGKSYSLLIKTAAGIEYTSLPEKIVKASEILGISAEFKKIPLEDGKFKTGFDIYAKFQDHPDEQNFYMWKNNGTYQVATFPELFVAGGGAGRPFPAPKPCCRTCWVNEVSADRSVRLFSDRNVNGNIVNALAAFIEDDGLRFGTKYLVRIEQHSLNREAFQFFQLLKDQMSINGDIFDAPPATIRGNMINLTNPDDNVIGYFRASDVSVDSLFITKDMLLAPSPLKIIPDDCREYNGGTTEKPSYW